MNVHRPATSATPVLWSALGLLALLAAWHLAALRLGPLLMATPAQTVQALAALLAGEGFRHHAAVSLLRVVAGVGLAIVIGLVLGLLAGRHARLRALLEPLRWVLMAVPGVIVVVLAMLWFGLGTAMVVFMTVALVAPGVYVNTLKGLLLVDPALVEMARVYRFGRLRRLRHVVLPALTAPLCAALLIATCSGVRLVVMAEVLGAVDGAGYALANARGTFDSAGLYAWAVLVLGLVAVLELGLLQPLQRHLTRWRQDAAPALAALARGRADA
ncbi:ABC transporter permease [Pseudoxanthomonas broegbernensis]|uniref:ABC transporter permease n=1 Tax=Pseudoxanthomonas broegbernensis TaxID=83619 RepID=A0A7V8GM45_9GAMM|nr:ABC transporter permease subunit [Pseudoxanthomonas broegbernensis]KAF1686144.1 ABC transporter permease [Pseudoxanthomonas broegbernensis]MBB6063846.1 NitT/TauT family transport system permease protein [Pseudoxanthomonas broegbernensis]